MKKACFAASFLAVALLVAACGGQSPTTTSSPSTSSTTTTSLAPTTSSSETTTSTTAPSTTSTEVSGAGTTTGVTAAPGKTYTAQLLPEGMVPPVTSPASGSATFMVDETGTRMQFSLEVTNITDALASRVHVGKPGANGPGVLILYAGPTRSGAFTGTLAGGSFGPSAFIGPLAGKSIADFVDLITSGQAYVSVGTVTNPKGEIRGQIR